MTTIFDWGDNPESALDAFMLERASDPAGPIYVPLSEVAGDAVMLTRISSYYVHLNDCPDPDCRKRSAPSQAQGLGTMLALWIERLGKAGTIPSDLAPEGTWYGNRSDTTMYCRIPVPEAKKFCIRLGSLVRVAVKIATTPSQHLAGEVAPVFNDELRRASTHPRRWIEVCCSLYGGRDPLLMLLALTEHMLDTEGGRTSEQRELDKLRRMHGGSIPGSHDPMMN